MRHSGPYTVRQWGRVYRSNGPATGIKGIIGGLSYQDVCEQIRHCSEAVRNGSDVWASMDVLDSSNALVSLGHFVLD